MTKLNFIQPLLIFSMLLIIFIMMTSLMHPIHFITLLLFYTIIMCMIMSMWKYSYIYSIMMFMIMISGLLIIFMYFASLISNEQNKMIWNTILLTNLSLNSMFFLWFMKFSPQSTLMFMPYITMEMIPNFKINTSPLQNITKIYTYPYFNLTLMSMFYLLISLFLVIKMTSIKSASLRKIHY